MHKKTSLSRRKKEKKDVIDERRWKELIGKIEGWGMGTKGEEFLLSRARKGWIVEETVIRVGKR